MASLATLNSDVKSDTNSTKSSKIISSTISVPSPAVQEPIPSKSENTENQSSKSTHDSSYLRDLYKSIRNINKKITNASKVDNVVAENPNLTLDELVATRKINADQKAQILKKPALQASLVHLEEQIAQYKKFDEEFSTRFQNEKSALEETLKEKASRELEEAVVLVKAQERESAQKSLEQNLLLISQFLKLAAIRRAEEEVAELEESRALEGLLAQVYSGDANAVTAMLNLIDGSEATLRSINGENLNVTYASLKTASQAQIPINESEPEIEDLVESTSENPIQNISGGPLPGLSEANRTPPDDAINDPHVTPAMVVNQSTATVVEKSIDINHELHSQEWDVAPKHNQHANYVVTKVRSWADDHAENSVEAAPKPPVGSDGFQEIQRNRGGRGDGHRGRHRGDGYRGRGRGGGHRGGRRSDD